MSQPIPFSDVNFKLAVVQELMYNQGLLPRFDLREHAAEQGFTYDDGSVEAVPEALAYFEALEVPAELAEKITEIEMDGGNEIYLMDADGGDPRRITTSPGGNLAPLWVRAGDAR